MKVVAVAPAGSPSYEVRIGPGLLAGLADEAAKYTRALVVSDANVAPLYLAAAGLERFPACVVEPGERAKRLAVVERVLDEAARLMRAALAGNGGKRVVYRRAGRPCPRCGTPIRSRGQGDDNRTAYWCPGCQRGEEQPGA